MDTTTIAIAVGGSLVFFGVLLWKAIWFVRKINAAEPNLASQDDHAEAGDRSVEDSAPETRKNSGNGPKR